jgi:DNA modification methylase
VSTVDLRLGDCLEILPTLAAGSVDAVITSPPYDGLRDYHGYSFDFENVARSLERVLKNGGVIVWVVGDSIIDGSETLTSFRQALFFQSIGLRVHDTMIYWKNAFPFPDKTRYSQVFEYMFVFSKGAPKTTNIYRVATVSENRIKTKSSSYRNKDGSTVPMKYETGKSERNKENIWLYEVGYMKSTKDVSAFEHPAMFPEALAEDHILSWTNPGELVVDPFLGSGTTGKSCVKLGRSFLGCEIDPAYFAIAQRRIAEAQAQLALPLFG